MTDARWAHDRRICTGDWVRLAGDAPSLRSVGKVVDGDYDAVDHTLRSACVDMGTRAYWVPPADLVRLLPDDEVRLCELALERGLVCAERDPSRLERLARALTSLREGTARYVRTPGLLDVLWGGSIHADPDHGSRAIAGFLDEALDLLATARREGARRPAPRARRVRADEDDGVTIRELLAAEARARAEATAREREAAARRAADVALAAEKAQKAAAGEIAKKALDQALEAWALTGTEQAPVAAPPKTRPGATLAAPGEVLPRIVNVLDHMPLLAVMRAGGLPIPFDCQDTVKRALVSTILSANVPLQAVLEVLTVNQLHQACGAVGLQDDGEADPAILRQRLLALSSYARGSSSTS